MNFGTRRVQIEGAADLATVQAALDRGGYALGDRRTRLAGVGEVAAVERIDGVLAVTATDDGLEVRHVDAPAVLAALRAVLPVHANLETEADPEAARLARELEAWRRRLWLAAPLSALLMVAAMTSWLPAPWRGGVAQLLLTVPVLFLAGAPFLRGALAAVRRGRADMDVLVALGTLAAFGYSAWQVAVGGDELYFETSAMIVTLVVLGRWLEARARRATGDAVGRLARLEPETADLLRSDGATETIPLGRLLVGDVVLVKPGATVPADGRVRDGTSAVDESLLTGESVPVAKTEGDELTGGTTNGRGALEVEVTAVGDATVLRRIVGWVRSAQAGKAPVARLADRVAAVFVPVVLVVAAVTFLAWWLVVGDATGGLVSAVAVLLVACPCALGLATPTAIVVGTGRGARAGILIKGGEVLERAARTREVVFDKTGTLTVGRPEVVALHAHDGDTDALLALVAAVERRSEHPLADAIVRHADARGLDLEACADFAAMPGRGAAGRVSGRSVRVGNAPWIAEDGLDADALLRAAEHAAPGATPVLIAIDGAPAGWLALADAPREEAAAVVSALGRQGLAVRMLSGDTPSAAEVVARELGIAHVEAALRPEAKAERLEALADVAMVGDGVNDAPALVKADVGIAVGGATDVASAAAGIALVRDDLRGVPDALALSRRTLATIRQNLFWAFAYNTLAIPLAAVGWLHPMIAAGAMALSSVSVLANSLRLRHVPLGPGTFSDA